jgi:hypothetical protein
VFLITPKQIDQEVIHSSKSSAPAPLVFAAPTTN